MFTLPPWAHMKLQRKSLHVPQRVKFKVADCESGMLQELKVYTHLRAPIFWMGGGVENCFERSISCHSIWLHFRFFDVVSHFLQLNLALVTLSKLPNRCVITWSALPALRSSGAACLCPKSGWRQQMAWRKLLCDQALLRNQDRFATGQANVLDRKNIFVHSMLSEAWPHGQHDVNAETFVVD